MTDIKPEPPQAWSASPSQPPLRFGIFMPPMHPVGQNPTLLMQRDVELIQHLDRLGFDEAWIGEHHSSGFETIASPEVFIGHVAAKTERIKLGTGVNSLPYHHPLILADRIVMLDHLTRGRMMFGVGPGQLTSDATMLGIDTNEQRRMMEESFDVIMRLFRGEIVTAETDWFTLREGRLQLRPYSNFDIAVAASISPSGPKTAGRYGVGLLSVAATNPAGFENLAGHWKVMEEQSAEHGYTVDRSKWRMMGPMYVAETEEEAARDCEFGLERVMDYLSHVVPTGPTTATNYRDRVKEMNDTGAGVVGTPDMAIAQIQRLIDQSGGFGAYLAFGGDLADFAQTKRSYELIAQYVMPHFQDQLIPTQASYDWILGTGYKFVGATLTAIDKARAEYAAERGEPAPVPLMPESAVMTVDGRYAGKVAVVTGAASGIGRATATRLVAEGAMVVGGDVNTAGLDDLAGRLGDHFVSRRCDVTLEADVAGLVAEAVERFGAVHAAFNIAGASRPGLIVDLTEDDWDFTVDLCLKGVFLGVKHQARQMIAQGGGGAIVNIASLNSRVPMFFGVAYSAAKAGVVMVGQTAALELGEHGIRVCTVSPGLTETPLVAALTGDEEANQAYLARIPLKRPATPEDIASAALYLASDDASYITGVNLFVDGAWEQTAYPDLRPILGRLMGATSAD